MRAGLEVGPFTIEKPIGSGAMGVVYLARYRKNGARVAIKVLPPGMGANETALARFEREAAVLKQLHHPNIVRFYAAGKFQGSPFYAMEFIDGEPLDHVLNRKGRMTWEEVVEQGRQICAALQHAHDQGIVHRDLKPSNLMVTPNGTIKLTDFGIAKDLDVTQLTAANCTVGTAAYMSPEQCRGEKNLSHKSDLYSFGVVLYELLTGNKPFMAQTTMDMFLLHVNGAVERPSRKVLDIPVWLDTLVCQLLEKKPEHRPYDATMVAQALDQVAEKVVAQKSAGVDAALARRSDRPLSESPTDASDRSAARTLRSSLRRKRQQRPGKAFYERGWLQGIGLAIALAGVAAMIYLAFRPPRLELLHSQAQKRMTAGTQADREEARKGPLAEFLRHYKDAPGEQAEQMRHWVDDVDVERQWRALKTRDKANIGPQDDGEKVARAGLRSEDAGDLEQARQQWEQLLKYKSDSDLRGWALVGQKRLRAIEDASALEEKLRVQINDAVKAVDERERLAMDALRAEKLGDFWTSRERWNQLKELSEQNKDMDLSGWFLLASRKMHDLKAKIPQDVDEAKKARLLAVSNAVQEISVLLAAGRSSAARDKCDEIIELYSKETDPAIVQQVNKARQLLAKLA